MKALGLDLGPNSIGWAYIDKPDNSKGQGSILGLGSRILGEIGDNAKRREKRSSRVQSRRRKGRKRKLIKVFNEIFKSNFKHKNIDQFIREFDLKSLRQYKRLINKDAVVSANTNFIPYFLRSKALSEELSLPELFRVLYSLSIRRGFLSNRKSGTSDDKENGVVYSGIDSLRSEIESSGYRTLGEFYLSKLKSGDKIRSNYTHRSMFEDEFYLIIESQKTFHKELNDEAAQKELNQALFYQRPLKSPKFGFCQHENGENGSKKRRRAPLLFPQVQEFRILQELANLSYLDESETYMNEVFLDDQQRQALFDRLNINKTLSFGRMRSILKLGKKVKFNLESEKRKSLDGNQVIFLINQIAGKKFFSNLKTKDKKQFILDLHSYEKAESLEKRLADKWKLNPESARALSRANFPTGTCNLSLKAIEKLRPHLENGIPYSTAVKKEYPHTFQSNSKIYDLLPPLNELSEFNEITNPQVIRSLSELRKLVNQIIHDFGKPDNIVIELARELKLSAKKIGELEKRNRKRQKARKEIKKKIESHGFAVTSDSIKRLQLAEECGFLCPYTGQKFNMKDLLGSGLIDIEHIIPYSRCLDNSLSNLTLCVAKENRSVKKNRTPFESYGHDPIRFSQILKRVSGFKSEYVRAKLERFRLKDQKLKAFCEKFESRALNDTQYISKTAKKYLALLYGGEVDKAGKRVIRACSGSSTSILRKSWRLNGLLSQNNTKNRCDHRHHALDATVIALTNQASIKSLSDAAKRGENTNLLFKYMPLPWPNFRNDLKAALAECLPSHRKKRASRGALHEETIYSKRSENLFTVRKSLAEISLKDLAKIKDKGLKQAIQAKIKISKDNKSVTFVGLPKIGSLNKGSIVKSFQDYRNYKNAFPIKGKAKAGWVLPGANHRMEIYKTGTDSKPKYLSKVISRFDHLNAVDNEFDGKRPELTVFWGEIFQVLKPYAGLLPGHFYRVKTVSEGSLAFIKINDARMKKDILKAKEFFVCSSISKFMLAQPSKISIDILGYIK